MGLFDFFKKKRVDETENKLTKFGECIGKGKVLYNKGKYNKAIIWLKRAIDIEPQWAGEPYFILGMIYQNQEKYDAAIDYFEKSNNVEPHSATYIQRGKIYQAFAKKYNEEGAHVEAYEWLLKADNLFEKAISDDFSKSQKEIVGDNEMYLTAEPISRKQMALLWLDPHHLKQLGQKITEYGVITVTMGDNANLAEYEISQKDYDWAKQIELVVDDAFAASQRKHYKRAIQYYKKALELAPGCDLFLMSVGSSYAQLGQKSIALKYLERAAKISPGNARIQNNLNNIKQM